MTTLKELRKRNGLKQSDVAVKIGRSLSDYSLYETGSALPRLEDIAVLENYFGGKIEFEDPFTPLERRQVIQNIITLLENYPLHSVFGFAARAMKRPDVGISLIKHYSKLAYKEPPLMPGDVCENCD